jgi:threonine dehydrogenase-like Zn-dependent dehydrogenase
MERSMKAVGYGGPRDMRVEDVPDAKIDWPTDALVPVTSTNICGSDLHMYEGRTDLESGTVVGHEDLGPVIEVGSAVRRIKKGGNASKLMVSLFCAAAGGHRGSWGLHDSDRRGFARRPPRH